ncbi:MAG TPA: DNA recombination protein RmuC [Rhizomicrobium sp.]|jgi:DNA recombination protein RmuC|nr:DNA recombination protein RmuC [Rhizomicrobium sp.]
MTDSTIIVLGLALLAAAAAFLAGRYLTASRPAAPAPGSEVSAVELARLQERERLLGSQIINLEAQVQTLRNEFARQGEELAGLREKSAGSEERVAGLERELAREKEFSASTQQKLDAAVAESVGEKDRLQAAMAEESRKRAEAERSEQELRGQIERAGKHIADRDAVIEQLRALGEEVRQQLAGKESEVAAAAERQAGLQRIVAERDEQLQGLQEKLKTEFENMANRILSATASELSAKSQESLATILDPLKNQISQFQQKVESTHTEDTQQRATISEQIRQVAQAGQNIGAQAENLTKALKGDSQLRGRWGEVRLERILEQAGLERGREFVVQGGDFNLKGEDGGSLRPDVIVLLPEKRHLVIDSKLSLVHYLEYESAEDDETRAAVLARLVGSVRAHAGDLSAKRYQSSDGLNAHELVLMFIPIESVAAVVLRHDDALYAWCWNRRVVMVSPSTLFMTMQTVASIWRYERQNENAQAIAQQAGQLFDKLAGFVDDLNSVSQKIQAASEAHAEAVKKLSKGKGNALSRAQKLKSLGVSSRKDFPVVALGGDKHVVEADDDDEPAALAQSAAPRLLEKPAEP